MIKTVLQIEQPISELGYEISLFEVDIETEKIIHKTVLAKPITLHDVVFINFENTLSSQMKTVLRNIAVSLGKNKLAKKDDWNSL